MAAFGRRWTEEQLKNPELDWSTVSLDQISLLIQLQFHLKYVIETGYVYSRDKIHSIVKELGFGRPVSEKLSWDKIFSQEILTALNVKLETLRREFEEENGMFESDLIAEDVHTQLESDTLNYYTRLLLTNPFSVWNLEKKFEIEETGNVNLMIENWNKKYYSFSQCEVYNSRNICFKKSIEYGNMDGFHRYYDEFNNTIYLGLTVRCGQIDMFEYMLHDNPKILDDKHDVENIIRLASRGFNGSDNTKMIDYLMTLPQVKVHRNKFWDYVYLVVRDDIIGTNMANVEQLLLYTPAVNIDRIKFNNILVFMQVKGWNDLFKKLANNVNPDLIDWARSFNYAKSELNFDLMKFLEPHLPVDVLQDTIMEIITDSDEDLLNHEKIVDYVKSLISLPQISNRFVEDFLRYITFDVHFKEEYYFDEYINILRDSGKVSPDLIEGYISIKNERQKQLQKQLQRNALRYETYDEGYHHGYDDY